CRTNNYSLSLHDALLIWLTHNELASQLVKHAKIADSKDEKFCVVFAAMGVKHDVAKYFRTEFEGAHVMDRVVMFLNLANDPIIISEEHTSELQSREKLVC